MFDTHCHLFDDRLYPRIKSIIDDAREAGVDSFVVPSIDLLTAHTACEIARDWNRVYAACGFHPTIDSIDLEKDMFKLNLFIEQNRKHLVAVGEIGLDYYHNTLSSIVQKNLFFSQLKIAARFDLSVIIHSRHAADDVVEVLQESWVPHFKHHVVFHCCEVSQSLLNFARERGVYIGVDGDITFDTTKQDFIREVPLELLVLETDSPYLSPQEIKSKGIRANEPQYLTYIRDAVAKIKDIHSQELERITTQNAQKLFEITI